MAGKEEIRGYIPSNLRRLLRAVITLRIDKDLTISDALEEAIREWLDKSENSAVVKKHRLDEAEASELKDKP